jgi:hypothetical protein
MGNTVERLYDVGVAGLHACSASPRLDRARGIIVIAGEGALPSVVARSSGSRDRRADVDRYGRAWRTAALAC